MIFTVVLLFSDEYRKVILTLKAEYNEISLFSKINVVYRGNIFQNLRNQF